MTARQNPVFQAPPVMVKAIGDFYVKKTAELIVEKLSAFVREWKIALKATRGFSSLGMNKIKSALHSVEKGKKVVRLYTLANTHFGAVELRYVVWERLSNGAYEPSRIQPQFFYWGGSFRLGDLHMNDIPKQAKPEDLMALMQTLANHSQIFASKYGDWYEENIKKAQEAIAAAKKEAKGLKYSPLLKRDGFDDIVKLDLTGWKPFEKRFGDKKYKKIPPLNLAKMPRGQSLMAKLRDRTGLRPLRVNFIRSCLHLR